MAALTPRARRLVTGAVVVLVGLVLVTVGYGLVPPQEPGWAAVFAGFTVIVGFTLLLVGAFLLIAPAVLPVK